MKTIRRNCFETNSSSTHTLAILPNSAIDIPIGQTIELKFTKKDEWNYIIDSNWKLFRLYHSNPDIILKYLDELNINVIISLKDLEAIRSEFSWERFEFDFDTLDAFTSYIWGESESESFDNNDSEQINGFINKHKNKGYLTQQYND
jgi:hypothetical protein